MSARTIAEIVACILLLCTWWYYDQPPKVPVGEYHVAPKAPEVKAIPQVQLACKPVYVYLPAAKEKLDLPPETKADPDKYVLDASTIRSDRHPQELVTVYDDKTGKVESVTRKTDYPWLQALQTGYVGVGYSWIGQTGYSAFVHEDVLAIKGIRGGFDASLSQGGGHAAGASIRWGW